MAIYGLPYSGIEKDPTRATGSNWPVGELVAPHEDLVALLMSSANHHAHKALQLFVGDRRTDLLDAAISAGIGLELACKGAVAQVEPTLLADRTDRDTLLRLSGSGDRAEASATRVKTISGIAAFRLARHFHKGIAVPEQDAIDAFETRNAAAHMALVERDELRGSVSAMSRAVDALLVAIGADRSAFWRDHQDTVDGFIEDERASVAQMITAKFGAARARIGRITAGLDDVVRATLLAALSSSQVFAEHVERTKCPVCEQDAWLVCWTEEGAIEFDGDPDSGSAWVPVTAYPYELFCSVCELSLNQSELAQLGLDEEIELEAREADSSDYDERDEDLDRDR